MTIDGPPSDRDVAVVRGEPGVQIRSVPVWAERLVRLLDDAIRVPGTSLGIGLDGIVGFLLPGAGDALTAVGSMAILFLAWRRGVPRSVLLRMLVNIGLDALLGSVPLVGDIFDVLFKSNRMNLMLLERWQSAPERHRAFADYLVVGAAVVCVVASILVPLLLVGLLVALVMPHI